MIPLRDTIPSRTFPYVTILLIIFNGLVFLFEMSLGEYLEDFISIFGIIPANYFSQASQNGLGIITSFFPFFTSIFLHGGWFHVIWNIWYLWIFGDNVEDHFGHSKFLLFYIVCGILAGLAHVYMNPESSVPTIGASGAIAGVMGAYIFLYPRARVLTLIPIFLIFPILHIPAYIFLGFWFLIQFLSGFASLNISGDFGGVAWWAHIGGFVAGLLTVILIFPRKRKDYSY
ncbi:rhomboid family intramembrane serine protease [candidate division KSB1 bacterium]|nr:rhomboid family intramembrane serine protease [candidate division KSB1 bacterium]